MLNNEIIASGLRVIAGTSNVIENAPMKEYTTFRAGGNADIMVLPEDAHALAETLKFLTEGDIPFYVMGEGSNTLVKDEGYHGVIVKIGTSMSNITVSDRKITAESGALIKKVSQSALEAGLSGLEFAIGIPGSVGGTSFMNAGAYDGEMAKVVESVKVLERDGSRIFDLRVEELDYGYRTSRIMKEGIIVLSTVYSLEPGNPEMIKSKMEEFQSRRKQKQPLEYPSAGSFFKRPPGNFAGTLIEKAGLKGAKVGGAMVSTLHAGFIINTGGATAADIISLKNLVQEKVYEMSGIRLEPEVRIIGG